MMTLTSDDEVIYE